MSYGNHINYNTGQTCDCSLAINGGHYYPNFCGTCGGAGKVDSSCSDQCDYKVACPYCEEQADYMRIARSMPARWEAPSE